MIPAGLVNALVQWATGDATKIAQLVAERDALIASFLSGGKPSTTLTSASANGKTFSMDVSLSRDEKLSLLTNVLEQLGEIDAAPRRISHSNFSLLER